MSKPDLIDEETQEWLDAVDSLISFAGHERAQFVLEQALARASSQGIEAAQSVVTPYINSIALQQQSDLPDDGSYMQILTNYMRWNALAMVIRGGKRFSELGGHIASYGSSGLLFEVGLTYFFHATSQDRLGDLVYFQGHSSPGIYARAFLEGRLTEKQLDHFRQEAFTDGLSSYPHPWLMPDFWQFPTVSMGLGPLCAIYQAQFLKYLSHRKLAKTAPQQIWCFCGDGELGEPESLGALNIAGREKLDNLNFVISCNLQRLDGPVSGNSQIIQEYEGVFKGAGWNVIKVIWGSVWDELFAKDKSGLLLKRVGELVDGEQQSYTAKGGAYMREHFFGRYPELLSLVSDKTDDELAGMVGGGHDLKKVYAAYQAAIDHTGQPTVILAKTTKGFGMGKAGKGLNVAHQTKKMKLDALLEFRNQFDLPLSDEQVENVAYLPLPKGGELEQYLHNQRQKLGGYLPSRSVECPVFDVPKLTEFEAVLEGSDRPVSSTMMFVRLLNAMLKNQDIKEHIVPILADESRTFGMEGLFRQIGIYAPFGQKYTPEDKKQLMYYREDESGQLLQQGISEAGGMASWIAAATSYSSTQQPMIPFFIYYSMFGFQRFGDLVWAAGDAQARGFIMGGTAGRTTLAGEGLQHQDGHNLLMFSMVPNCISYDPCFGYELAVILQDGLRRMYQDQENVFYYVTLMNENYLHPAMPKGAEKGILQGIYCLQKMSGKSSKQVRLLGGGTILNEVIKAAEILQQDYQVDAEVWSVTSFNELRRNCESVSRYNRLHPKAKSKQSVVSKQLGGQQAVPIVAATDYMKLYAEQIRQDIDADYTVLGTDGYGRSDTRQALREFFEVNANMVVYSALQALFKQDKVTVDELLAAQKKLGINVKRVDPVKA